MIPALLVHLYKINSRYLRWLIRNLACKFEGGEYNSTTIRRIFKTYYAVDIGLYTHGGCFIPGQFDRETSIGRYSSVARGVKTMNINHPLEFKSTHAFFFNAALGKCPKDCCSYTPLTIGHDVWIGFNALILPHTRHIGNGAVIAAGAVVNKDVPPYAIVVGNPARVVRFRFSEKVITELEASQWWTEPIDKLDISEFSKPFAVPAESSPSNPTTSERINP